MKTQKVTHFILFIISAFSAHIYQAQKISKGYSQVKEYGIKGSPKKAEVYIVDIDNSKIPTDTLGYSRKTTTTFSRSGNIEKYLRFFKPNPTTTVTKDEIVYTIDGKDFSYTENTNFSDRKEMLSEKFKYIWKDDYHYDIINIGNNTHTTEISLDENFLLKNSKLKAGGKVLYDSDYTDILKNNIITKRLTKTIEYIGEKPNESYQIEVIKKQDKFGNPSLIYIYDDKAETNLVAVAFRYYEYY
ncbi:hypothetical protein [Soonwooa sp.]|uniref:hypothetical protein n=1 Tax=Soonwooa sp. TaxID=1938592 RepID=UPI00260A408E|nr:hypothetical protein [Soonwooa sp.]